MLLVPSSTLMELHISSTQVNLYLPYPMSWLHQYVERSQGHPLGASLFYLCLSFVFHITGCNYDLLHSLDFLSYTLINIINSILTFAIAQDSITIYFNDNLIRFVGLGIRHGFTLPSTTCIPCHLSIYICLFL